MNYFFQALKKYATFSGRARRKEFWHFILLSIVLELVVSAVLGFFERSFFPPEEGQSPFLPEVSMVLFTVGFLLPRWAVIWRRMHDVGKSGWFGLIPIYNLILACQDGNKGENRFGPDPKG
jgi:uncharacterized membrane protein YhaH (DUF805 family)